MNSLQSIRNVALAAIAMLALGTATLHAQMVGAPSTKTVKPPGLQHVGIEQHLDAQVPLDLHFKDEQGRDVKLGDYFRDGRPVILNLVYYQCTMLCNEVLNGLSAAAKVLSFTPGKEYEIVTVSIDPRETPKLAAEKKANYMKRLGKPGAENGWHFLTGQKPEIDKLADTIGWQYQYDALNDQFAHAAGVVLVTPQGKTSQYYYGVEYSARDMRLGIIQASENKIGTVVDALTLYCYHYDPRTGRYGAVITNIVRLAGGITVLILGSFLALMFRREKHEPAAVAAGVSVHDKGQGRA